MMAAEQGHDPIVAVAGCVAQQEGEAIFKRSPGVTDVIVGTQAIRRLPMLVEEAAAHRTSRGFAVSSVTRLSNRSKSRIPSKARRSSSRAMVSFSFLFFEMET